MSKNLTELAEEIAAWIGSDPSRRQLLIDETPIAASTLRQTLHGRYIPGELLINGLRTVMKRYPVNQPKAGGVKAATG